MNHLAHFFLNSLNKHISQPESIIGSFLGDYVKGQLLGAYPAEIEAGIHLHRHIDAFTDRHVIVKQSYQRFQPPYRRYAPIMTDLVFDHFLASYWNEYHHTSLEEFNRHVFGVCENLMGHLPETACRTFISMRDKSALLNYTRPDFIEYSLNHISRRLRRTNPLDKGYEEILGQLPALESDFRRFFPELQAFAISHRPLSVR